MRKHLFPKMINFYGGWGAREGQGTFFLREMRDQFIFTIFMNNIYEKGSL